MNIAKIFAPAAGKKRALGNVITPPSIEHTRHLPRGREYPGGLVLRLVCEVLVSVSCVSRLPPVSLNRYVLPVLPDTHDLIRANASLAAVRDREA